MSFTDDCQLQTDAMPDPTPTLNLKIPGRGTSDMVYATMVGTIVEA